MAEDRDEKDKSHWVAKAALAVSIFALLLTIYRTSPIGAVEPVMPLTSYALVRGIDPDGSFAPAPSDHLVLPLEFTNNSGSTVHLKRPRLELDEIGAPKNKNITFFLTGEYEDLSPKLLNDVNSHPYTFASSLVLGPHSVSQRFLVFRVSQWTKDANNYCFRFHQGQKFQMVLKYERIPQNPLTAWWWGGPEYTKTLEPVLPMIEGINDYSRYSADYVSLLPGSRAVNADGSLKDIHEKELSNETFDSLCPD